MPADVYLHRGADQFDPVRGTVRDPLLWYQGQDEGFTQTVVEKEGGAAAGFVAAASKLVEKSEDGGAVLAGVAGAARLAESSSEGGAVVSGAAAASKLVSRFTVGGAALALSAGGPARPVVIKTGGVTEVVIAGGSRTVQVVKTGTGILGWSGGATRAVARVFAVVLRPLARAALSLAAVAGLTSAGTRSAGDAPAGVDVGSDTARAERARDDARARHDGHLSRSVEDAADAADTVPSDARTEVED